MKDASKRAVCSEIVLVPPMILKAEACSPTSVISQTTLIDLRRKKDFFVLNLKDIQIQEAVQMQKFHLQKFKGS